MVSKTKRLHVIKTSVCCRHYWIQDMNWMYNDLYLALVTKHGAVFIVPRLGNPVLIKASGSDVNIGPALYITIHPLIVIK
jgi:hypothetical protein